MSKTQLQNTSRSKPQESGWFAAYKQFLLSKDESVTLKLAPLALAGILPPEILTNAIPVLGLVDDIGFIIATVIVIVKTRQRVKRYRQPDA